MNEIKARELALKHLEKNPPSDDDDTNVQGWILDAILESFEEGRTYENDRLGWGDMWH